MDHLQRGQPPTFALALVENYYAIPTTSPLQVFGAKVVFRTHNTQNNCSRRVHHRTNECIIWFPLWLDAATRCPKPVYNCSSGGGCPLNPHNYFGARARVDRTKCILDKQRGG